MKNSEVYDCCIEISQNSDPIKYEIDKKINQLRVDRIIPVSMRYPANYGYFPNTEGGDNDPLDVLVITEYPILPGAYIRVRPIGVLKMEDEGGMDEKILAVACKQVDPHFAQIHSFKDINENLINRLIHFFERYKDLEKHKWVKFLGIGDVQEAMQIIQQAKERYELLNNLEGIAIKDRFKELEGDNSSNADDSTTVNKE